MRRALRSVAFLLVAGSATAGCEEELPPTGQIVLHVETDATLASERSAGAHPALFDRLRVEWFEPGKDAPCDGCLREFAATQEVFLEDRASTGFVPRPFVSGYRARATLYRHAGVAGPRATSSITTTLELPAVGADGIAHVWAALRTADVGAPRGALDAPLSGERQSKALRPGTWDDDVRRECTEPPGPFEACVPGGGFFIGSASHPIEGREHLVKVSPFYVDVHEVTVREFRRTRLAREGDPSPRTGCNFSPAAGEWDDLPINCISHGMAAAYCERIGKKLLTEAQFERVATGLGAFDYPWGRSLPECGDAVFARDDGSSIAEYKACVSLGVGATRAGAGALDRLTLGGVAITDLAGNLSEWMLDTYNDEGDPCFASGGLLVDPICTAAGARVKSGHAVRGGSFATSVLSLRGSARTAGPTDDTGAKFVGLRCARSE